jgi:hypothetical protein
MTPENLDKLAERADPEQLWRAFPPDLTRAMTEGRSLLITPLTPSSNATRTTETPADHARLRGDDPQRADDIASEYRALASLPDARLFPNALAALASLMTINHKGRP